jgi:hypothetical protein
MTALFNFHSLLLVILLTICTSTYAHYVFPGIMDRNKANPFVSPVWKAARVGERLSPYVAVACVVMAVSTCPLWTRDNGSGVLRLYTNVLWAGSRTLGMKTEPAWYGVDDGSQPRTAWKNAGGEEQSEHQALGEALWSLYSK